MKVLLLGSGGRESALAWSLDRASSVHDLVVAPGNPGIARIAETMPLDPCRPLDVVAAAQSMAADLVVVGPEAPLVAGVGDALRAAGIAVFGPDSAAAHIEGSKTHAKDLMQRAAIPTAAWRDFSDPVAAVAYLDELGPPYVIKADGLAAGKGVVVTTDRAEAVAAVEARLVQRAFGDAGARIVIEEFLDGEEASVIAFSDGTSIAVCEPAQDYKRVGDDDTGPNTGGMGSYSPVPSCPTDVLAQIEEEVLTPMVATTAEMGAPFVGALYAGLALTGKGPKVVEFNARFGDPETQALLPRLGSDLGAVMMAAATGDLAGARLNWRTDACVCVVLASGGYPGSHEVGFPISGLEEAAGVDDVHVFHAGTRVEDGEVVTAGGRVMSVSALGSTFKAARDQAYTAASKITFEKMHLRRDIARRAELAEGEG
ncbi:MAG: phosphoribosylamine--glycine ligase [Actinomycetota bacterium]|nr:phosphoribosylamine--glycine ligase [Actinomycetota bacterium]